MHLRLVRHAEVTSEHRGRLYGGSDVPLSPEGLAASRAFAPQLAVAPLDAVVSSPLQRALLLAQDVAARAGVPLLVDPGFRELDRGRWTGLSQSELEACSPGALARYTADPERCGAPGGERESQLSARVWAALQRIAAERPGQRLLLVAHAHVLRVIMARLAGWTPAESMQHFLPKLGVIDARLDGECGGELLEVPPPLGQSELLRH